MFILERPDITYLQERAKSAEVEWRVAVAISWEEARSNLNPWLRGHYCWNAAIRELNCEVGVFQIRVSTAKQRCPAVNIWTYEGNIACFFKMFKEDTQQLGVVGAITRHNGSGRPARDYTERVLATVGRIVLTENQFGGSVWHPIPLVLSDSLAASSSSR